MGDPSAGEAAGEAPASQTGRVLSKRYRLNELIATGGMGAVYLGEHLHMKKRVAIKLLLPHAESHPQLVERFEREAIAGAQVTHENVAAATDFGKEEDGTRFLVMEHVRGESLASVLATGPIPPPRALAIAADVAAALEAIHERGIVHRDLKPANIIVGEQVKVIDFGFAKVDADRLSLMAESRTAESRTAASPTSDGPDKALTTAGDAFGTVRYMAPEVARGMGELDGRADLYALGVILYEMLAGKTPFDGEGAELFAAIRAQPPPPIAERSAGVQAPPELEALAMQLLAKEPSQRFASATALRQALGAVALDPPLSGREIAPTDPAPGREPDPDPHAVSAPDPTQDLAPPADSGYPLPLPEKEAKTRGGTVVMPPSNDELPGSGSVAERLRGLRLGKREQLVIAAVGPALAVIIVILWLAAGDDPVDEETAPSPSGHVERPSYPPLTVPDAETQTRPIAIAGKGPTQWRRAMLEAADRRAWMVGAEALLALAELAPESFDDGDVRRAAVRIAVGMGTVDNERSARVFLALGDELGEPGLAVLYELLATKGGTKAWTRTRDILREPTRRERMSPALRVAYELRVATCEDQAALFGRAAEVGDHRALKQLQILLHASCREGTACCYRDSEELKEAVAQLERR